ncbi:hypothetical protein JTE90_024296 [Oedothorax gibbosus]|uniref:Uncharacterized protein n=1 Tax=Oedothorax gibbosus TaxID=931172 RepID=A0AAV6W0V1_9ARAC|nr:hypothetical protein JTE90_024296 [Oedothorax gibbosus]
MSGEEWQFAEDLVHFVVRGHGCPSSCAPPLRFVPCVGHVVRHFAALHEERLLAAFERLRCVVLSGEHFDEFARHMHNFVVLQGGEFDGAKDAEESELLNFLSFCAQLTRLASLFHAHNVADAPAETVRALVRALRPRPPFSSWDALYDACFRLLHRIPRARRCVPPPTQW